MENAEHLITPMLQGFVWMDEGLQSYLRAKGWPEVTRPQSMIMSNLAQGVVRPSDIARNLGVSRQAIHVTIRQMVDVGILELVDDPADRRSKIIALSPTGVGMKASAQEAMRFVTERLRERIGDRKLQQLKAILATDWGEPPIWCEPDA